MTFIPRTKDQIRDSILANMQSRYQSMTGRNCDIRMGSHYWIRADAIALELAGQEAAYELETKQILPDKADTDFLDRHGNVEGVPREQPTAASHTVSISGTPGAVIAFGSATFVATSNLTYAPSTSSTTLDAIRRPSLGTLAVNAIIQWSAAPTGCNPTATVLTIESSGTDQELDAAYAIRIIARRQDRPASWNRADVVAFCEAFHSVTSAYVYPLLEPDTDTTGIPGTFTVVVLGPIPVGPSGERDGDSPTNTRFIGSPGDQQTDVEAYFEGTVDAVTVPVNSQVQLRPLTVPSGNYRVRTATQNTKDVTLDVVVTAANVKQWSGLYTIVAGTNTTTHVTVSGDHTNLNGLRMLVPLFGGPATIRGAYKMVTPSAAVLNGSGDTVFTVPTMEAAPLITAQIYPAPANYPLIRKAIFSLFDRFTPGDAASPSQRWPGDDIAGPSTLYVGEIITAVCLVPGVINCTVSLPAANIVPGVRELIDLYNLIVTSN